MEATEVSDILLAHLHKKPATFAALGVQGIPAKIEKVVFQLLTKYPHERIRSVGGGQKFIVLKWCSIGFPPYLEFIIDSSLHWLNELGGYH